MDYQTGANGFIGRKLFWALEEDGRSVSAIPHEAIDVIHLNPFEHFYFLSSFGNMAFHSDTNKIIKANVGDLIHILKQINFEDGMKSFVYFSSSSVKRKIQTMYSRCKKASEEILLSYIEKYDAPICIVRPLSVTGVGDQPEHLIPTLIRSCLEGEEMPFVAEASHDYIDVDDVVSGVMALSKLHAKGVFELGTGVARSNSEVKDVVEKVTGKKAHIKLVSNMRSYDSSEWTSTNFRARQYGWAPKKPFEQTVKEMVEAYKHYEN